MNEQPEQTAEGLINWLRDDADFQDHQRENGIPMLPSDEDAPHLRAAADMLERLESKLDFERQAYAVAANTVKGLQDRLDAALKTIDEQQRAYRPNGDATELLRKQMYLCRKVTEERDAALLRLSSVSKLLDDWKAAWDRGLHADVPEGIAKLRDLLCDHNWIDATNERVTGTDYCSKCGKLRAHSERDVEKQSPIYACNCGAEFSNPHDRLAHIVVAGHTCCGAPLSE